ncbi:MAG: ThuA domain-containing protein [Opitutales bacterium]|nr:ThuA domain-containing protein [Opitutales bacterium]
MSNRALIVHGGWEGHVPAQTAALISELLGEEGLLVDVSDSLEAFRQLENTDYSLVVPMWTMGTIDGELVKVVSAAVRNGAGLAGFHGGMGDAFRNSTDWQFMTGAQFVAHPGDIIPYTVEIANAAHPVTRGLGNFSMESEQYYMHFDPAVRILATTTFSGEHAQETAGVVMPVAYTKEWGDGRVFYCSLGHTMSDLDVPECRTMILRGMLWAARNLPE